MKQPWWSGKLFGHNASIPVGGSGNRNIDGSVDGSGGDGGGGDGGGGVPPLLTFFGSKQFGYVVPAGPN